MSYEPKQIDTSEVKLSDEILKLTELLAKNAHDIWAQQRVSDGWIWVPERNDAQKNIPILYRTKRLLSQRRIMTARW
jgi:ryanodine receptor 2